MRRAISNAAHEAQRRTHTVQQAIDLIASLFRMHTPLAEVLAVVRENVITIFANARHRTLNDLCRVEMGRGFGENPQWTSSRKALDRNGFHRPDTQTTLESAVVHDETAADIDTVMRVARPRAHNVSAGTKRCYRPTMAIRIAYFTMLATVHD